MLCICNLSNDQKSPVPLVTKRSPVVYNETMRKLLKHRATITVRKTWIGEQASSNWEALGVQGGQY